jgi:hypothetical protein
MNTATTPAKDEDFFGPYGDSLRFESSDDCNPKNEMLKLQRRLTRTNMRKFKPEFERWILQLYLRWAFNHSSNYFRLPFIIRKNDEKRQGCPDFACQESDHGYALEVTQSTMQWQQKMLGDKSGLIEEGGDAEVLQNRWAQYVHNDIIKKTGLLRTHYPQHSFKEYHLLLYDFLLLPLDPEDISLAHQRLIEIAKNNSDLQDQSKLCFKRISVVSEGRGAILDVLGDTPTFLAGEISPL